MPTENDATGETRWTFLPADCLALLPFQSESLNRWRSDNDLSRFLGRLACEEPDLQDRGTTGTAPEHLLALADEFSSGSTETYHERLECSPVRIDYRLNAVFGGFAKAWTAWQAVETELLSENGSFSLAHTLETTSDMECAIDLAKRFYYRQAAICLRTFIEDLVYPLYFFHHRSKFDDWKVGKGKLPRVRGAGGILEQLVKGRALDSAIAGRLATAYGAQNQAVHGDAGTLVNAGTFTRDWRGRSFKAVELTRWLQMAKECLECGLFVLKRVSDDWLAYTRNRGPICDRCHSRDYRVQKYTSRPWVPVEIDLGGVKFVLPKPEGPWPDIYVFTCQRCGDFWHGTRPNSA